jgi:hypothetical protein
MKSKHVLDGGPENDWPVGDDIIRCGECHTQFIGPLNVEVCYMCSGLHSSDLKIYKLRRQMKILNYAVWFFCGALIITLFKLFI